MPKIELNRLQKIIREELSLLREGTDHEAGSKLMSSATKLLGAIETFKESTSSKASAEMGAHLDEIEKILKRIADSPMRYVDATNPPSAPKKVSLKPQKSPVV